MIELGDEMNAQKIKSLAKANPDQWIAVDYDDLQTIFMARTQMELAEAAHNSGSSRYVVVRTPLVD